MKGTINAWLIVFLASLLFIPTGWFAPLPGGPGSPQQEISPVPKGQGGRLNEPTVSEAQVAVMAKVQSRHEMNVLKIPGVRAIGIGLKGRNPAFVVSVDKADPKTLIPSEIEGYPVTVKIIGEITINNGGTGCVPCHATKQILPVQMGNSIGTNQACGACTDGFVACNGATRGYVTNRHCNFDSNGCDSTNVFTHLHRGRLDATNCSIEDNIGTTNSVAAMVNPPGTNTVDASFITSSTAQTSCIEQDGGVPLSTTNTVAVNECVHKSGRTSGYTNMKIVAVNVTVNICGYCSGGPGCSSGFFRTFVQQLQYQTDATCGIGPPSLPGDSGSAVHNTSHAIVGLNFAGNGVDTGFGNLVANVLGALGLTVDLSGCGGCLNLSCSASTAVAGTPQEQSTLNTLYAFRDQVLSRTPQGQVYVKLYEDNTAEAAKLLASNIGLLLQARQLIFKFTPIARDMIAGKPAFVAQADFNDADRFLNTISNMRVSPKLQSAIDQVRRDMRNGGIQAQFGVNIGR